jgi:hypothetical protein
VSLLDAVRRELAPAEGANRLVPLVAEGAFPLPFLSGVALAIGSVMWGNEPDTWLVPVEAWALAGVLYLALAAVAAHTAGAEVLLGFARPLRREAGP